MAWNLCLQKYEKGMTYPKGILSRFNRRIAQKGDVPFLTHPLFRWSWRDSNSRPNEELICFLHVYLRLRLSGASKTEATHLHLIL